MIEKFEDIVNTVKGEENKTIAVAMAQDEDAILAVKKSKDEGIADAVLVGDEQKIKSILEKQNIPAGTFQIVHVEGEREAIKEAISLIRKGDANVLMKGKCSSANYLRGILDKEHGLREGDVLSHLAVFEVETYKKLILMSDAALNIYPDLQAKIAITNNAISAAHRLKIDVPKVALITAIEKVNHEAMPCTADAAIISKMAQRGQIKGAEVDGPLAVDNALSLKSCQVKGIKSSVGGDADILIMPNIETGNCFYKLMTTLCNSKSAGIILGAQAPVVLPSRADSEDTKFYSIAVAMLIS